MYFSKLFVEKSLSLKMKILLNENILRNEKKKFTFISENCGTHGTKIPNCQLLYGGERGGVCSGLNILG